MNLPEAVSLARVAALVPESGASRKLMHCVVQILLNAIGGSGIPLRDVGPDLVDIRVGAR